MYIPVIHFCLRVIPCRDGVVFEDNLQLNGETVVCFSIAHLLPTIIFGVLMLVIIAIYCGLAAMCVSVFFFPHRSSSRNIDFLPSAPSFFVKISGRYTLVEGLGVAAVIIASEMTKWGPLHLRPIILGVAMIVVFGGLLILHVLQPPFTKRMANVLKTTILLMCVLAGVVSVSQGVVMVCILIHLALL